MSSSIISEKVYGIRPHTLWGFTFSEEDWKSEVVLISNVTIESISNVLDKRAIPQSSFVEFMDSIQDKAGVEFDKKELLNFAKENLKKAINNHYESDNIKTASYHRISFWLDSDTRASLLSSIDAANYLGEKNITFILGERTAELTLPIAKELIYKLQRYADSCFITTQEHLLKVDKLNTIEEVVGYDYKSGYAENIEL